MTKLIYYPNCSTSKKAVKYLNDNDIEFKHVDIVKETPTKDDLQKILKFSDEPINKLFNTSGKLYRALDIKSKINTMSDDEKLQLLSNHGMLIKRPLLIYNNHAIIGFNENKYDQLFK